MGMIETDEDIRNGADFLCDRFPEFAAIRPCCEPIPLRRTAEGFPSLLRIVIGQQVSTASAAAIWGRLKSNDLTEQHQVAAASQSDLRACGLSRPKIRYALELAGNPPDFANLHQLNDQELTATLTKHIGIGPWTAEAYGLFCMGRPDIFPAGDLALQEAACQTFHLHQRPDAMELKILSENWAPWRGVAARMLWAYYAFIKKREGALK